MKEHLIGIDLGGTNLRCAVIDRQRNVLARHEESTLSNNGPDEVIARAADRVHDLLAEVGLEPAQIIAVGVGAPGPLDSKKGVVLEAPNLGWRNVPLAENLRQKVLIEVVLENDANCAGWGEYWAGAGRGCNSMVLMTLGTGVGGALILNGQLYRGRDGTAGEIGHVVIVDGGRSASTGNRGVLEAYASASATVKRFREAMATGWESCLDGEEKVTCEMIFNAAHEGDALACHIVTETGRYLGVMAANLANLLNPERCVFSGGMIKAGDILFNSIREECNRRAFPVPSARMEIVPAELGENAGIIGAAGLAMVAMEADRR